MTLTEARETLEKHRETPIPDDLRDALDTVIPLLPKARLREPASSRLNTIRNRMASATGHDPFASKSRDRNDVIARQCVWYRMKQMEGYNPSDIGRASGYNHSTVLFGVEQVQAGFDVRDKDIKNAWETLLEALKDEK